MSSVEKEHFADKLFDESTRLDMEKVRIVKGGVADINDFMGGVVLWNHIHMSTPLYRKDYRETYEDLFGHELTHAWQHQNRRWTGYSIWAALFEQLKYRYPYEYDQGPILDGSTKPFLEYRYEQQGAIVQAYFWYAGSTWPEYQEYAKRYLMFLKHPRNGMVLSDADSAALKSASDVEDMARKDLEQLREAVKLAIEAWERFDERKVDSFWEKFGPDDEVTPQSEHELAAWLAERARRARRILELMPRLQSELGVK